MLKVLTPNGFQQFDGIRIQNADRLLLLTFTDGSSLKCTYDHKIQLHNKSFIEAKNASIGDRIFASKEKEIFVASIEEIAGEKVYDLLNVKNGNAYWTNNVVSHNCVLIDECLAGKESVKVRNKHTKEEMDISLEDFWKML